jgi:hypothetical protein
MFGYGDKNIILDTVEYLEFDKPDPKFKKIEFKFNDNYKMIVKPMFFSSYKKDSGELKYERKLLVFGGN